jgi:hypothetical protein
VFAGPGSSIPYDTCTAFTVTPVGGANPGVPANLTLQLNPGYPGVLFYDVGSVGCSGVTTATLHLPAGCASGGFTFYLKTEAVGPWTLNAIASDSASVAGFAFYTQGILIPVGLTDQLVPNLCSLNYRLRIVDHTTGTIHALSPNHALSIGLSRSNGSNLIQYDGGCTSPTAQVSFFADAGMSEPISFSDFANETTTITPLLPLDFQSSLQSSPFFVTANSSYSMTCGVTGQYCDNFTVANQCCGGCASTGLGEVWPCN